MIRKLVKLIKNYDKIMEMIDNYDKDTVKVTQIEPKKSKGKAYSMFNVPREQMDYIVKKQKGEI